MKKLHLAVILLLVLSLCLCACGKTDAGQNPTDESGVEVKGPDGSQLPEGYEDYAFCVQIKNEEDQPVAGVQIQVCSASTCTIPVTTDANGIAAFATVPEGELTAKITGGIPEGYKCVDGITEIAVQAGDKCVGFVLREETGSDEVIEYAARIEVVYEDGSPVIGVQTQVCSSSTCSMPVNTDEKGVAIFYTVPDGELTAKILAKLPEGYECKDGVNELAFSEGQKDVKFVLVAIAGAE